MSTKTFDRFGAYFAASLVAHALIAYLAFFTPKGLLPAAWLFPAAPRPPEPPVVVEVVDIPPQAAGKNIRPDKVKYVADRDNTVTKETVPHKSKASPTPPPSRALSEARPAEGSAEAKPVKPGDMPSKETASREKKKNAPVLFPTDTRLAELSRKYEASEHKGETGKTLSLNTGESKYQRYMLNLKRRIELYWEYPGASIQRGEQGALSVVFVIGKDGAVKDVKVVRSSNYPGLDDAAVTAIKLAAPFNPFPKDFDVEDIQINGNFEYRLVAPVPGR
ncbi:MAG: energy transducer TonB [Deltaproteobacteria bacterium]|nr:energy transducer TonB [Deltaproteobacteria bacterium]